jgi:segregation and condensation protein A
VAVENKIDEAPVDEEAIAVEDEIESEPVIEPEAEIVAVEELVGEPDAAEAVEPEAIAEAEVVAEPEISETPEAEPVFEAAEPELESDIVEEPEGEDVMEPEAAEEVVPEAEVEVEIEREPVIEADAEIVADEELVEEREAIEAVEVETVTAVEVEAEEAAAEPVEAMEIEAETEPAIEEALEGEAVIELEAANEAAAEPVAEEEADSVAEPEFVETPEVASEIAPEIVETPADIDAIPPEAEAETESEPVSEPAAEEEIATEVESGVDEAAAALAEAAPVEELAAVDGAPTLVLNPEPTAEEAAAAKAAERTAAKLVARQKKLDASAEQSPFSVLVDKVYDGPLDLLLDLIRKQDIDIYDIPIAKITAQFLAYVNQLKSGDVDVAGEFIYTASLLIHIKSKMLLPRADSGQEDAAEDPRRELVERLLEHERFKNAAQMLQEKQMLEAATWSNPGVREFKGDEATEPEIAADTVDLVRIFRDILERARKRPAFNVNEDAVTVGQMIQFLTRRLTMEDKPVALRRLLSHTRSERALIAMFLALLELVRLQAILLRQDLAFSEIFIKKNTGFDAVMNEGLAHAQDDWR